MNRFSLVTSLMEAQSGPFWKSSDGFLVPYWEVSPFNWSAGVCIAHTEAIFSAKIKWHSVTIYPSVLFEAVTLKWEPLTSLAV